MMAHEVWILAIAALTSISCAIVGVLLVLRRMAMLGDAISHSVLLGLVVAFLLTDSRSITIMLAGAALTGLATAWLTQVLNQYGKLQEDASMGIIFTLFFAVAVILISLYTGQVDLDQECVLYGEIAFAPFDTIIMGNNEIGPRSFWVLAIVTVLNLVFLWIGYYRLKAMTFNASFAASIGIQVGLWNYSLMALVATTTAAAFEAVGVILVVALIVIPANTAFLLARSLHGMLFYAIGFGVLSSISGYYLARYFDASISASIAVMAGVFLALVLVAKKAKIQVDRKAVTS